MKNARDHEVYLHRLADKSGLSYLTVRCLVNAGWSYNDSADVGDMGSNILAWVKPARPE